MDIWSNPDVDVLSEISGAINDRRLTADQQILELLAVKSLEKFAHRGPLWDLAIDGVSASFAAIAEPESTLPTPPRTALEM